jgi:fermentation-respiration switch protein FrsA (DUF1100 family)
MMAAYSFQSSIRELTVFCLAQFHAVAVFAGSDFSDSMIFQPHASSYQDNEQIVKLSTRDGVQISAVYLRNDRAKFTILFSHGNSEDLGDILPLLKNLHAHGFSVFAYDYHGYGTSGGKASETNAYADIDAAYEYLTGKHSVPPSSIILHGRSLGGGPSIDLASRQKVGGLILESTFTTAFGVVLSNPDPKVDKFRSIEKLSKVHCPVLVIHGKADQIIPWRHGESLLKAANEPKQFLWVENAGHNNLWHVAGEKCVGTLRAFADRIQQPYGDIP